MQILEEFDTEVNMLAIDSERFSYVKKVTALLLLPVHLGDDASFLHKQYYVSSMTLITSVFCIHIVRIYKFHCKSLMFRIVTSDIIL